MAASIGPHPGVAAAKAEARKRARAQRAVLHAGANATGLGEAYHQAADLFFQHVELRAGDVVAVYLAHGHEFDIRPILKRLLLRHVMTALPVVEQKAEPLIFREWSLGEPLVEGAYDIPVPKPTCAIVVPNVVLVPLMAFDDSGMRLGQGGGFYDRTLSQLRAHNPAVMVVGLAFEGQKMVEVPHDALDARLDAVVTEERFYLFSDMET